MSGGNGGQADSFWVDLLGSAHSAAVVTVKSVVATGAEAAYSRAVRQGVHVYAAAETFACDANGNVSDYVGTGGASVAHVEYDPFGNALSAGGPLSAIFPRRFSTKYLDTETGLYSYGYRFFSPSIGRWLSRDPIEDRDGMNLYVFWNNNAIIRIDPWGMKCSLVSGPTVTGTDWIVRDLDVQTPAATYSALIDGVSVTWGPEGEVKCCCDFLFVFRRNVTKTVFKTVTASLPQNTFPIVAFAPGNGPGRPSFHSIPNGIGKVRGGGTKKILGKWGWCFGTDYGAGLLTCEIENTKPASLSDGDWPYDPCNE